MIKRILSLVIMFQAAAYAQNNCPQGQVFNTSLNRCVLKASTIDQKTESLECEGLSGSALEKCVESNVKDQAADENLNSSGDPKQNLIIPGIVAFTAGYALFAKKDAIKGCGSVSTWLMLGGGTATFLGEILARRKYKEKLGEAKDQYKEMKDEIENGDSMENLTKMNVAAFDFQIQQEEARKAAHKARKDTYNTAFGLYSAATIAAVIEQFKFGGADSTCNLDKHGDDNVEARGRADSIGTTYDGSQGRIEGTTRDLGEKINPLQLACNRHVTSLGEAEYGTSAFNSARAECMSNPKAIPSVANNPAAMAAFENPSENLVTRGMRTPWVRAALSGVLAGHSKVTSNRAKDLVELSEKRITGLKELRDDFLATGGAGFEQCSDADRRSPSKPFCFCYNSDGQQDQSKADNEVCENVWNSSDFNMIAGRYGKNAGESEQGFKGCLRRNGVLDPGCSCRKEKDASSGEACTNIAGTLSLGGLGGLTGLPSMINDTAKYTNGRITSGQLASGSDVDSLVKQINLQKEKLSKNPKYGPTLKKIDALEKKMGRQIASSMAKGLANGSITNPLAGGLGAGADSADIDKSNVLAKTKDEIKALEQSFSKMAGGTKSKKKRNGFDFDLGGGSAQGGIEIDDMTTEQVMNKKFNYKTINQNPDTDIFQIISVRYQRSGFRRLFDEEGISQADEANDITIHGEN